MTTRRHPLGLFCTLLLLASCGVELSQGNSSPYITSVGPLSLTDNGQGLHVHYSIADTGKDDATILVQSCEGSTCLPMVAGEGGDGTQRVPTVPREPNTLGATHLFVWNLCKGVLNPENNQTTRVAPDSEIVIQISVVTNPDRSASSRPFKLSSLGFDASKCP